MRQFTTFHAFHQFMLGEGVSRLALIYADRAMPIVSQRVVSSSAAADPWLALPTGPTR